MEIRIVSAGAALLLTLAISGCSKKVPECNSVIDVMNAIGPKIKGADKAAGVAGLKIIHEAEEKAAGDLAKLEITIPEVKKIAGDFQKNLKASAAASKKLMASLEDPAADAAKTEAASKEMDAATEAVSKGIDDLNKFCQN